MVGEAEDGRVQVQLGMFQRVMGMVLVAGRPLTFKEMCILLDMNNERWAEVRNVLTQVRETSIVFVFVFNLVFFWVVSCLLKQRKNRFQQ